MNDAFFWNNPDIVKQFSDDKPSHELFEFLVLYKKPKNIKVLDLGCGAGRNSLLAARLGFDIYACDLHRAMINATRKKLKSYFHGNQEINKRVITASMLCLPFPNNSFDLIIANGVFHQAHSLSEYRQTIFESSRVVRKNGLLYLNVFTNDFIDAKFRRVRGSKYVYMASSQIKMTLLPKELLMKLLSLNNIVLKKVISEKIVYIGDGRRFVLKAIFERKT